MYDFAEEYQIVHSFNNRKVVDMDSLRGFRKTYKISLKTPEATSIGRAMEQS